MRLSSGVCTCAVTLTTFLVVTLAQKDPSRPLNGHNSVAVRPELESGKRYGSSRRNDVRRYGPAPPAGISDGHRLITRALWRIFDALMQKKDHSQLYGRMTFVEDALKKMISVDSQLEDEIDKLKDDMVTCKAQMSTVMEELGRLKVINSRLEELESTRIDLREQGDEEHALEDLRSEPDSKFLVALDGRETANVYSSTPVGWKAAAGYSACPSPFQLVEGECFFLSDAEMVGWEDARRECGTLGGDLASPRNLHRLRDYLSSTPDPPEYLWVGGSQRDDGTWVWASGPQAGVPLDMSKDTWNEEVPSGPGKCMGLFGQSAYRAYNYDCKEKDFFVCQYYF